MWSRCLLLANSLTQHLQSSAMTSCVTSCERRQQAVLILLDQQRLPVDLTSDLMTSQLLKMAADSCQLVDFRHFGIARRTDSGENHWLHADMRVMEHDLMANDDATSTPLQLHFLVRYYPESFRHLTDPVAVELLFQQVRSLVFKGELNAGEEVFRLAALSLQAAHGDYTDDGVVLQLLKRTAVLPSSVLNFCPTMQQCEARVCEEYRSIVGTSRGSAIVLYLSVVEKLAAYGVHFYTVTDKSRSHCLLGISSRGIAQYPLADKAAPKRLFAWKNLENVTFRDKRFSIEVDEPKKVVHALSSFNVYEEAISGGSPAAGETSSALASSVVSAASSVDHQLISAISEPNTQVSVSRRTLGPGHISVYSWFTQCQSACRSVWLTAVSLHQYHVESNREIRAGNLHERDLSDLTRDLCHRRTTIPSLSLLPPSTHSTSTLSRSDSCRSLPPATTDLLPPQSVATPLAVTALSAHELRVVQAEMAAALLARRQTLESQLSERLQQLRLLCLREAELTGLLPSETPLQPGEQPPAIRRRMGTSFQLPETLLNRLHTSKEIVAALELDLEIQRKITTAALKLANDASLQKTIRKQRRLSYQMSAQKLKDIEGRLKAARTKQKQLTGQEGDLRPSSDGEDHHTEDEDSTGSSDGCTRYYTASTSSSSSTRGGRGMTLLPPQHSGLLRTAASVSSESASHSAPASPKLPPRAQSSAVLQQQRRQPPPPPHSNAHAAFSAQASVGYVPSSVYTRSSYRIKHYPTLSNPATLCADEIKSSVAADAPILPPPPQYWSADTSACRPRQPVHHLSVDELDCGGQEVTPLQVDGSPAVEKASRAGYSSLGRRRAARLLQYADSPLSGTSEAVNGRRAWQETSLDCVEVAARRRRRTPQVAVVATPAHVIPLESAATPRQRHQQPGPGPHGPPVASAPAIAAQSPVNQTLIEPGSYQPYRETTKPFEMADFYKYSERYRRSQSTLSPTAASSIVDTSPTPAGAKEPWVPAGGCSPVGSSSGCSSGADSSASEQLFGPGCSLAEAIQSEMMGWLDSGRGPPPGDAPERSRAATLV